SRRRNLADIAGDYFVPIGISPSAPALQCAGAADRIECVGADGRPYMQRPTSGIVEGHSIEIAGPQDPVVTKLCSFSDPLPATMNPECARSWQSVILLGNGGHRRRRRKTDDADQKNSSHLILPYNS